MDIHSLNRTAWDKAVLNALCDAKPAGPNNPNYFDQSHVDAAWTALQAHRSAALGGTGAAGADKPIQGLAMPLQPAQLQYRPELPAGTVTIEFLPQQDGG